MQIRKENIMPVKIPPEVQEFLKGKTGWVATSAKDGTPNVSLKGSLRVLDDGHLVFADINSLKTRKNLEENPKVAVMAYDAEARKAYMLKGSAEMLSAGPLFDQVAQGMKQHMPHLPAPKYVVRVTVEAVFDQSGGPGGGKQLA
jgi:predicted pyridoxine 5'-phosphate oxidase superfamily flavin-nucleotide-binding protein